MAAKEVTQGQSTGDSGTPASVGGEVAVVTNNITRTFHVSDLSAASSKVCADAINTVGIALGDPHPFIGGAVCSARNARVISDSYVEVSITYSTPNTDEGNQDPNEDATVRLAAGSSLRTVSTERDLDGPLIILYKPGEKNAPAGAPAASIRTKGPEGVSGGTAEESTFDENGLAAGVVSSGAPQAQATVTEAAHTLTMRTSGTNEQVSDVLGASVEVASQVFTNTINAAAWHGGAAYQWKCTGITGETEDKGKSWQNVTATFEFDDDFHNPVVVYVGPDGRIPADVTEPGSRPGSRGNGSKRLNAYYTANFNLIKGISPEAP